jgi:predicted PurR-regulated permease PerM
MNEVVHADIFFFITSIAVVVLTIALLVLIYYAIVIARQVKGLVERVEQVEKDIELDIAKVRASLTQEGVKTKAIADLILGFIGSWVAPRKRRVRTPRSTSSSSEE